MQRFASQALYSLLRAFRSAPCKARKFPYFIKMPKLNIAWIGAPLLASLLASCSSSGGSSGVSAEGILPPDGYVFDSDSDGFFGDSYATAQGWDASSSAVDPKVDLPGGYLKAPEPPKRPSTQTASRPSTPRPTATSSTSRPKPATISLRTHTVARGDTIWGISKRYGISQSALKSANGLTSDSIQPGQVLRIDGSKGTVASRPPAPKPKPAPKKTHVVAKGETLWSISQRYKVSIPSIRSANGISGDILQPGDTLRIP